MKSSPLYPFQTRARNFVKDKLQTGIFIGYGGGKTYLSLQWLEDLQTAGHDVFPAMVLVLKTLIDQWGEQIEEHSNFTYVLAKGTAAKRIKSLKLNANISVVNYDIFRSPSMLEAFGIQHRSWETETGKVRHAFKATRQSKFKSVIVDESTSLKEKRTQRFGSLYALCQTFPHRALLAGKPILERPEELFAQMYFLDDGKTFGKSFWKFRHTYFAPGPPWAPYAWILKPFAEQQIAAKLSRSCISIPEEEVTKELPPKRYIRIPFKMDLRTRTRYNQLRNDFDMEMPDGTTYETIWAVSRSQKMHQLCQGILYKGDAGYTLLHTMKLDWLKENIPLMLRDGPVLIWTHLVRLIPLIAAVLKPLPLRCYKGEGMNDAQRAEAKESFKCGKVDVLILSEKAAYAGHDLWRANKAVFVSTDHPAGMRENAEKRCHRIGSEIHDHVTYYDLVVEDSLDEVVLKTIEEKLDIAQEILKHVRRE